VRTSFEQILLIRKHYGMMQGYWR